MTPSPIRESWHGFTIERDNVKEMIRFMADHAIQHIVYTRLDRAFRSTADALLTITECAKHGVKIHFCEQDLDFTTAMGRAMLTVIALFAELETDLRLQRQLETVSVMRQSGFKAGRNVPYGWNKVPSATRKTRALRSGEDLDVGNDTAFDLVPNWEQQDVLVQNPQAFRRGPNRRLHCECSQRREHPHPAGQAVVPSHGLQRSQLRPRRGPQAIRARPRLSSASNSGR
jgi:Resolvase, N terminal domain